MKTYRQPPAYNKGTGLSWKYGPPRPTQSGVIRSGLGNYMPRPLPGAPEPLGCSGGCGCDGGCGGGGHHHEIAEAVASVAVCGLLALGAGVAIKSIIGLFKSGA